MKLYSEGGDKLPVIGRYGIMRRLTKIWRDLKNEQQWKYRELPPATLFEALKLNLLYADESEFARAGWFWLRRPKPFTESLLRSLICVFGWATFTVCAKGWTRTLFGLVPRGASRGDRGRGAAHNLAARV